MKKITIINLIFILFFSIIGTSLAASTVSLPVTGDFNGDGKSDLLWRNKANGKIAVWLMNGTAISSYDITGEVSDLNWGINNKKGSQ